jgi:hypothetical protein
MSLNINQSTDTMTTAAGTPAAFPQHIQKCLISIKASMLDSDPFVIAANAGIAIVTSTAASTGNTITLPSSPADGQILWFTTRQILTAITWAGGTITGAPSSMTVGQTVMFVYSSTDTKWYTLV